MLLPLGLRPEKHESHSIFEAASSNLLRFTTESAGQGQFPSSHPEAAGPNGRHLAVRRKRWGSPRPSENEAHASESCHAGSVNPAGEVVSVCTDPGRHPRPSRLSTPALNSPPTSGARARPGPPGSPELGGGSPESLP